MPSDPTRLPSTDGRTEEEMAQTVLVVGGEAAKGLASHFDRSCDVVLVSHDEEIVRAAERDGIEAREADVTSGGELATHADGVDAAVVAAERDRVSLLSAQLLRTVCDVPDVAVLLNDPANHELFEDVDVSFLEDRTVLGREVERTLFGESP